jgi:hypothetical protein
MLKAAVRKVINAAGVEVVKKDIYKLDGLATLHNCDFISDPRFSAAYQRGVAGTPDQDYHHGPWRAHVAAWAADTAMRREGDFVECGVYLGFISALVMTYVDWNNTAGDRRFLLIDSYEGVSKSLLTADELASGRADQYGKAYVDTYARAKENLSHFKNTELIKGFVPDILPEAKTEKIAYLHIDMNSATPEIAALEYFWDKLVPGALILLDDYAYVGYKPQLLAMNALGEKLGFSVASLPTGQGLIVR